MAWPILMDVSRTAAAFPGAGDIEDTGGGQYQGRITVKIGPLTMIFAGRLTLAERDDTNRRAMVRAQWNEIKGRGNVLTATRFELLPTAQGSLAKLHTDLQLAGQVAQYGRAAGMLQALSAELIRVFAQRLREGLASGASPAPVKAVSGVALVAGALGNLLKKGSS